MSTTIRAEVHKIHGTSNWRVVVGSRTRIYDIDSAPSWPEAMQLAYKLRTDFERELMDEVHAERASRRETAPVEVQHCRCGHNEWQHQVAGTHCGAFLPGSLKRCWCTHYQPQHSTDDPNTMEATA